MVTGKAGGGGGYAPHVSGGNRASRDGTLTRHFSLDHDLFLLQKKIHPGSSPAVGRRPFFRAHVIGIQSQANRLAVVTSLYDCVSLRSVTKKSIPAQLGQIHTRIA